MADLRQIDVKKQLDELADTLTESLCGNAIEDWPPIIRATLTEAVRAALGEPTAAMVQAAWKAKVGGHTTYQDHWNAMAAARLRELDAELTKETK